METIADICRSCGRLTKKPQVLCRLCRQAVQQLKEAGPEASIGTILKNKYQLTAVVKTLESATVYEAEHLQLHIRVAVKVLDSHLEAHPQSLARFQQEAAILSKLSHPNIVRVLDYDLTPFAYLVTDYVEGTDIVQFADQDQTSLALIIDLFAQLSDALVLMHGCGLVHRDLKPESIIVQKTDAGCLAKVVDFGLAKTAAQALTLTGECLGSPPYMSPEQCAGLDVDQRSDLYSLGCVFWETLTGEPAFQAAGAVEYIHKHLNEAPKKLQRLRGNARPSAMLREVLDRCLAKDRNQRFQSAAQLHQALRRLQLGGKPTFAAELKKVVQPKLVCCLAFSLIALIALSFLSSRNNSVSTQTDSLFCAADQFRRQGLYRRSRQCMETVINSAPGSTAARLARTFIKTGLPKHPLADQAEARNFEAAVHAREGRRQEAASAYVALIRDYPDFEFPYVGLAALYFRSQPLTALTLVDRAVRINNDCVPALLLRAAANQKLGNHKAAQKDCDRVLSLCGSATVWVLRADAAIKCGQYRQAVEHCDRAISCSSKDGSAYAQRALAYLGLGQYEQVLDDCSKVLCAQKPSLSDSEKILLHSNEILVYLIRAQTYLELRRFSEAIADCEKVLAEQPDCFDALNIRAAAYFGNARFKEAAEDWTVCIQQYPRSANLHVNRAIAHLKQRHLKECLDDCQAAIAIDKGCRRAFTVRDLANGGSGEIDPHRPDEYFMPTTRALPADHE